MATYYWVGGAGTWNTSTTTNWASSTGGAGGAGVPLSTDNVIIDTASGTGTITCTAGVCQDLTVTATQAIILGAASSTLSVYGNLTLPSSGSFSASTNANTITFAATTTGKTITTNGISLSSIVFNGVGGYWTLGSNFITTGAITLTAGTFDTSSTGNYSITSPGIITAGALTRAINLNASTLTLNTNTGWTVSAATGLTVNAGTSNIILSSNGGTFVGGGLTYYNLSWTGSYMYTPTLSGSNTFNNMTINYTTAGNFYHVIAGNQTINGTFTVTSGSSSITLPLTITSGIGVATTVGTQSTIIANAISALSNINFRDIVIAGNAVSGGNITGTRLGDCGNNSGITFQLSQTVYWNNAGGGAWLANVWSNTPGGTVNTTYIPLPQDTVIFQNTGLNSGATITLTNQHNGIVDFSARTLPMTISNGASVVYFYGNLKLSSALTITGSGGTWQFSKQNTIQQITTAGVVIPFNINAFNYNGTLQLQDAMTLSSSATLNLTSGTLDSNNQNLTIGSFNTSGQTYARTLKMGASTWNITGSGSSWNAAGATTNYTLISGTSTINFSNSSAKTFYAGYVSGNQFAIVYNRVTNTGGALTFNFGTSFNNLTCAPGSSMIFPSGATTNVNSITFNGNATAPVTIASTSTTNYTLTKIGGGQAFMNYVTIGNCTATPANNWYAFNSTSVSNNTGIIFQTTSPVIVPLLSRVSNVGVYSTNAITNAGIFDEVSNAGVSKKVFGNGMIMTSGILDEFTIAGSSTNGSILFNGTSQYLSVPSANIGTLSGATFTFETFAYLTGYSASYSGNYNAMLFSTNPISATSSGLAISLAGTSSSWTGFEIFANNLALDWKPTYAFSLNTWYHIALTRTSSGLYTIYVNGTNVATTTSATTWTDAATYNIGWEGLTGYGYYFPGSLTNLRLVNGSVVYSSNFTTPSSPLLAITNTTLLLDVLTPATYLTDSSNVNNTITANASPSFSSLTPFANPTAMREYPNGNIAVSGYFDEVTGGLVTNGLIAYIDASKQESYVRSGTNVFDLVNPANPATINGAVTWVANGTSNASSYWWWPSQASANYINGTIPQNYLDFTLVFQPDFTLSTSSSLTGLIGSSTDATSYDESLRMINVNGTGPWKTINPDNANGWANVTTTFYINGVGSTVTGQALATGWNIMGGYRTNQTSTLANGTFGPFNYFLGLEGYSGDQRSFRGNIAAVAFYNRQLSAGEQINNYNYFAGRFGLPYIGR